MIRSILPFLTLLLLALGVEVIALPNASAAIILPAPISQVQPTEVYYLIQKQGTGAPDDPIRARYMDETALITSNVTNTQVDGIRFVRQLDDPSNYFGGVGLYAVVDAIPEVYAFLDTQLNAFRLGDNVTEVITKLRAEERNNTRIQAWLQKYPADADLEKVLKIRRTPLNKPHGTDTTDFTDADGTTWPNLTNFPLTNVAIAGTGGYMTLDVLTNQGRNHHPGGGSFLTETAMNYQTVIDAEDMTVSMILVSTSGSAQGFPAARILPAGPHGFYCVEGGNGVFTLQELVSGSASQLDSGGDLGSRILPSTFTIVVATNGATQADIDCSDSAHSGAPQITGTYTINAALQGQSGRGGLWRFGERLSTSVFDTLAVTDNDAAAPASRVVIID